jgi:S-adenosylmethionine-dependent methyltransferase
MFSGYHSDALKRGTHDKPMTDKWLTPDSGHPTTDTLFDDRVERFTRKIYGSRKGELRLALLWEDMMEHIPSLSTDTPLSILDAGGGLGHMSIRLAEAGHSVLMCEPSIPMLDKAREQVNKQTCSSRIRLTDCTLQTLGTHFPDEQFDLVLCHAVLEWLGDPMPALEGLLSHVSPGGYLSLAFFNIESIVWKNLMKGNFRKVLSGNLTGETGSLTPPNPLHPQPTLDWIAKRPLFICSVTGIRCLSDYMLPSAKVSDADLLAMERELGRRDPYRWLGRYIHVIARRL